MAVNWKVVELERSSSTNKSAGTTKDMIITAHWRAEDSETVGSGESEVTHYGASYGTCSWQGDATKEEYIPYSKLTEEDVIRWIHESESINKDDIEASVQAQIAESKAPKVTMGLPW
tara:strand:+ start:43 stop:393 length:351 start_codon:yes stop_codon:yes gene_type:complete